MVQKRAFARYELCILGSYVKIDRYVSLFFLLDLSPFGLLRPLQGYGM